MTTQRLPLALLALATLIAAPVLFAAPATQPGAQAASPAEEFKNLKGPTIDRSRLQDLSYRAELQKEMAAYNAKRAELAEKLLESDPNAKDASTWLGAVVMNDRSTGNMDHMLSFCEKLRERTTNAEVKRDCLFQKAVALLNTPAKHAEYAKAAEDFIAVAEKNDRRAAGLLYYEIELAKNDADKKTLSDRLMTEYPESGEAQRMKADARRKEQIGKPFELAFTDAISGKKVDVKDLKGKVLVIDFWATWCGPCVAEMPEMKKVYAEFHPKGVEFLGVSLDQPESAGGLEKLKAFCKEKEIPWPQYYQGNGWESTFSKSWGIDSIPCMFVVDADGNLADTQARGKLEEILPKLIAKRDGKSASAAQ
jgi:thiol-disulfide isomerase/thioredoxin